MLNFGGDRGLVLRQIGSKVCHLASHHRAKREDRAEGQQNDRNDGKSARNAQVLQPSNHRRKHEAQDAGKRNWEQNFAGEEQDRNNDHQN